MEELNSNECKCGENLDAHLTVGQVGELLDTYIADRNGFLIDRAKRAYRECGRGVMLLDLSEAAFNAEADVGEAPTAVHYRYLASSDLADMPDSVRQGLDDYDPDKECIVAGYVALDGAAPEFAVRVAKLASPIMSLLREKGDEIRATARNEYRKQGRGLLLFVPPPSEMLEMTGTVGGYLVMYVPRDSGHPIFKDDPDAVLLVDGYDPEHELCYIAIEPERGSSSGRISFDGKAGAPIPGFTDHEDTAQYKVGRFADLPPRPTVHDAIFGKPQNARDN